MHIAHFTNSYYPLISGVVRSVSSFRQALTELGHNVFVFAQHASDYEDQEPFIFRYPSLNIGLPGDFPATIPFSPFIDNLFPSLKVEVIHSHHPVLLGQAAANIAEDYGLPLVFTFHTRYREYSHYFPLNRDFVAEFVQGAIVNWLRNYVHRCQHIVVPSESMRQRLVAEYGLSNDMTVIPTGIDLTPYQAADGKKIRARRGWQADRVLVSIGRLAKEKNWETLLAATQQVMESHPDVRLVIIGEGDDRDDLEEYAQELGIARRVEFTGKIPFDDIPSYLKAADLFCFASVTETQGLVTMEAMAAGLPVVAVDATGTSDVVAHDREGILTNSDPDDLARGIARVLDNEDLQQRYRQAARKKARSFDIKVQAQKLVEVYAVAKEAKKANQYVKIDPEAAPTESIKA